MTRPLPPEDGPGRRKPSMTAERVHGGVVYERSGNLYVGMDTQRLAWSRYLALKALVDSGELCDPNIDEG